MYFKTLSILVLRKILSTFFRNVTFNRLAKFLLLTFLVFVMLFTLLYNSNHQITDHEIDFTLNSSKILGERDSLLFKTQHLSKNSKNILNQSESILSAFSQSANLVKVQLQNIPNPTIAPSSLLIDTEVCRLQDWPLFDHEIVPLFENYSNKNFDCDKNPPMISITRFNFTWIKIDFIEKETVVDRGWVCFAKEIKRTRNDDKFEFGPEYGPLGRLNNFANNLTNDFQLNNLTNSRWDAVKISCRQYPDNKIEYSRVVPLIQHYKARELDKSQTPKMNIMLLGLDSVSRLNFLRHMNKTKRFLESHNFVPLLGYHKVGENSFPNIVPMFTGNFPEKFSNQSMGNNFKFDNVPLIFKDFQKMGYITTFVEDMPPYGFFSERGGFRAQPTDYYLRPVNLAIWGELYYTYSCYQRWLEHEIYWNYVLDQFEAFRIRGNQSHFTFVHLSTLTHNYFNHPGYADKPYHQFLQSIFTGNYHENSVIFLYSDHGLRFGEAVNTTASLYEQRLPFIYIYLPDNLSLNGRNASQLRDILRLNQNRHTSHFDLLATMLHLLYGTVPHSEPFGLSLLNEIPTTRTCEMAGIKGEYCLCNSYKPIPVTEKVDTTSIAILEHINQLMANYGNYCVPLTLRSTYRAFESIDIRLGERYRLVHFQTDPSEAIIEGIVRINSTSTISNSDQVLKIENISRLSRYGSQSACVEQKRYYDIVPFCYCWDVYEQDLKNLK